MPSWSPTATNASMRVLPAPAPKRAYRAVDLHRAGARRRCTELATARPRLSWPWKPTCASSPISATSGRDAVGDLLEDHRAGGVDDVDALAAGVGHDPGLLGEHLGRLGVGHHQEADGLQAELAGQAEVLDRDVGLGAVGGDRARSTRRCRAHARMSSLVPTPGQHQARRSWPASRSRPRPSSAPLVGAARSRS